jgi:hypothetical protein
MYAPWMMYYYYPQPYMPWQYQYWPQQLCPSCRQPNFQCWCNQRPWAILPQDIQVDDSSSPKEVFVGGIYDTHFTLEYMPVTGATNPAVKLTITDDGNTSTWDDASISDEYHVKSDFPKVSPGAKATLETTEALARLRWFEVVEY